MSALDLWNSLSNYLSLTYEVTQKQGSRINVNEQFTVTFTLRNTARRRRRLPDDSFPQVRFLNPRLNIQRGIACLPLQDGERRGEIDVDFPVETLSAQAQTSVDVEFVAIGDLHAWWGEDQIGLVRVQAELDQNRFFSHWQVQKIMAEIVGT